jgi:hypothetical protein
MLFIVNVLYSLNKWEIASGLLPEKKPKKKPSIIEK